jgi:succinoglycan biosynthesis protein ExoO
VAVLDSDDWYAPERLEVLLEVAYANNADIVADDLYFVRDGEDSPTGSMIRRSGEKIQAVRQINDVYFVNSDMEGKQGLRLGFSKPLFRQDFLRQHGIKYDEAVKVSQDFWLDMECMIRGARFFFLPTPYYYYRVRQQGALTTGPALERLEQECDKINKFCIENAEYLSQHPALLMALRDKFRNTRQTLDYRRVAEPLKNGRWASAISNMVVHPYFFLHLVKQTPIIISRRIQYFILGNRHVFDRMH